MALAYNPQSAEYHQDDGEEGTSQAGHVVSSLVQSIYAPLHLFRSRMTDGAAYNGGRADYRPDVVEKMGSRISETVYSIDSSMRIQCGLLHVVETSGGVTLAADWRKLLNSQVAGAAVMLHSANMVV